MAHAGFYAAMILLALWCVLGVALTALRLPGTWLILGGALLYGWWADWAGVGWWMIGGLAGAAVLGELVELLASVVTARRSGASKRASWGGLVGAFAGMFLLSFLVPIPIVGSIVGAIVGCFCGAVMGELTVRRDLAGGSRAGFFAALGFVLGMAAKTAIAAAMAGALLAAVVLAPSTGGDEPASGSGTSVAGGP